MTHNIQLEAAWEAVVANMLQGKRWEAGLQGSLWVVTRVCRAPIPSLVGPHWAGAGWAVAPVQGVVGLGV